MSLYRYAARPALFAYARDDPESAHELVMSGLAVASRHPSLLAAIRMACGVRPRTGTRRVFGLDFPNPVGAAGGLDKTADSLPALAAMGFGFVEAGTITRLAQPGKDRPRIFRLPADHALINRVGFPNAGADAVAAAPARQLMVPVPVGWNIGKSLATSLDAATADYLRTLGALYRHGDFFTVNVSSPNTPGLRDLQRKQALDELLEAVVGESRALAGTGRTAKPVLLKISPDLSEQDADDIVEVALARGVAGIIATNTTLSRAGLGPHIDEAGGMSGRPLAARSLRTVEMLTARLDGRLPIVGVGGIDGPGSAERMLDAGASLLQIYTGFIYEGPRLIRAINARVRERWLRAGTMK